MARLVAAITVDTSGLAGMHGMIESLQEALATAQFDEPLEVDYTKEGLFFAGQMIARVTVSGPRDWTMFLRSVPTFFLPIFAAEICRIVPGVKVRWTGGWPRFSASGGDDLTDDEPDPVKPEMVDA